MTAVRAVQTDSADMETIQKEIRQWREEFLTDRYVGWKADEPVLTSRFNSLSISETGRLKLPNALWNAETTYEARRIDASVFLRQCRKIILKTEEEK